MSRKILFSPVGGTDPIKYLRDGSMLHICRFYKPDIVYLYLSHEMLECHNQDNRYVGTINKLGEFLNHSFDVRLIERKELVDVQQYDVFYEDFREEIRKIEIKMNEGDQLLVNMASGTPAMKSALLVMATLAEYRFLPIQVSTPQNKMNSEHEDRTEYDVELNWELNEDNAEGAENRCVVVKSLNMMKLLKMNTVKKHIEAYDYTAALAVADEIKADISEDAYRLLEIAEAREKLNLSRVSMLMREKSYDIYPIKEGNKQRLFEYTLGLKIRIEKQEYADFIRGITPLVVDLLAEIMKKECGIKLEDCCTKDKNGVLKWDKQKLNRQGLFEFLDNKYNGLREGPVYAHNIAAIIENKSNDAELIKKVNEMVEVEKKARHVAAHEIVSVTDEWFQKRTQKNARGIFEGIKYLVMKAGIHAKDCEWNSYDQMNEKIKQYLR